MRRLFSVFSPLFAIWILLALLIARFYDPFPVETLRLKSFDYFQQNQKQIPSKQIALLDISEKTLKKLGQWPWARNYLSSLISELRKVGVGTIVFPMLFAEKDRFKQDRDFASWLKENGTVITQVGSSRALDKHGKTRGVAQIGLDPKPFLPSFPGVVKNIKILEDAADGVGMINSVPEIDGVVRRIPMLTKVRDKIYPSLALEIIRVTTGDPSYQVKTGDAGIIAVRVPKYKTIFTDNQSRLWVRWNSSFARVDVVDKDWSGLKGKIVIIGTTAEGLASRVATPNGLVDNHFLQASLLETVLQGKNLYRPDFANFAELCLILLFGVFLIVIVPRTSVKLTLPLIAVYIGGILYGSHYAFDAHLALIDPSMPVLSGFLIFSHLTYTNFARENKLKLQIKKQFETYLDPKQVKRLQKNPDLLKLGGETKELTFLFSDVRGFTAISEQYKTNPQNLTKLINRFLTPMTNLITQKYEGTIDKYMGDCIMAFWNAPIDVPHHKELSIKTALEMQTSLKELNVKLKEEELLPLNIGIGVNTGECVVGNMGSDNRFDFSVIGDPVNLAARLEGQSKAYGVCLVVGEDTIKGLTGFDIFELDTIAVKGKTEGVKVFTVYEKGTSGGRLALVRGHKRFMTFYYHQNWEFALQDIERNKMILSGLQQSEITTPITELHTYYNIMQDRILEYQNDNDFPKDWNGTYVATSK